MVSKNQTRLIRSLDQKKYRNKYGLFVAEGLKVIEELLKSSIKPKVLYTTQSDLYTKVTCEVCVITEKELQSISFLSTPNTVLGLFEIPVPEKPLPQGLQVALDSVRDPGNLGTIIRLCDWFGVNHLICSLDTVDCYNPKVVQATMGSLSRVQVQYTSLESYLSSSSIPVFSAVMEGANVYTASLPHEGIIVMGNESNGISPEIAGLCDHQLTIPRFGDMKQTESLNVAMATAILLSEFRRGTIQK
ncbi:RNA methyltransferase [Ascidiimonas aurantiaca]|uniref:RNA methyltransferase n=1 Tax=Ascidiimonas aurantiaca TaxID=1685432 RepID=UPI0030EE3C79